MNKSYLCIEQSKRQLSALGQVMSRAQFGGYSLSVERVVFALIKEGILYLRSSERIHNYVSAGQAKLYRFNKRGCAIYLNYFQVENALWQQPELLLELSRSALTEARLDHNDKKSHSRLKDLPNLDFRLEASLRQVGVNSVECLRTLGARQCWVRLRQQNPHLGLNRLFALQGAIYGQHQAVLDPNIKAQLEQWYQGYLQANDRALKPAFICPIPSV